MRAPGRRRRPHLQDAFLLLGESIVRPREAAEGARYATVALREIDPRVARISAARRPRVYYARGPRGLETAMAGSINGGSRRCRSSRC